MTKEQVIKQMRRKHYDKNEGWESGYVEEYLGEVYDKALKEVEAIIYPFLLLNFCGDNHIGREINRQIIKELKQKIQELKK